MWWRQRKKESPSGGSPTQPIAQTAVRNTVTEEDVRAGDPLRCAALPPRGRGETRRALLCCPLVATGRHGGSLQLCAWGEHQCSIWTATRTETYRQAIRVRQHISTATERHSQQLTKNAHLSSLWTRLQLTGVMQAGAMQRKSSAALRRLQGYQP
ncbi:unnamed protein product [Boreogadus saida]